MILLGIPYPTMLLNVHILLEMTCQSKHRFLSCPESFSLSQDSSQVDPLKIPTTNFVVENGVSFSLFYFMALVSLQCLFKLPYYTCVNKDVH
jgi:hypothetical protein